MLLRKFVFGSRFRRCAGSVGFRLRKGIGLSKASRPGRQRCPGANLIPVCVTAQGKTAQFREVPDQVAGLVVRRDELIVEMVKVLVEIDDDILFAVEKKACEICHRALLLFHDCRRNAAKTQGRTVPVRSGIERIFHFREDILRLLSENKHSVEDAKFLHK